MFCYLGVGMWPIKKSHFLSKGWKSKYFRSFQFLPPRLQFQWRYLLLLLLLLGDRGNTVVKVLCYKMEGRWGRHSLEQKLVPGVFPGGKGDRCVRLTTYHHPMPLSRNLENLTSWNPLGHSRPVTGLLYLLLLLLLLVLLLLPPPPPPPPPPTPPTPSLFTVKQLHICRVSFVDLSVGLQCGR